MKKILIILLTITIATTLSAQKSKKSNIYKISGSVKGFTDSTKIYLSDLSKNEWIDIDSTIILNERFRFSGILNQDIENYAIHTQGFKDRVSFWIDNTETFISAEKGKFKEAIIKGSKAQSENQEFNAIISISKNEKLDNIKFIQNKPGSIISANTLNVYKTVLTKDTVLMLYNSLSKTAQNTIYGKRVLDFLSLNVISPKVGDKYVDFEEQNIYNKTIKLSDLKNKIVLLEFWGSWCGPCREGHPELVKIYNEFKDQSFEILGIATDNDKKKLQDAILKDGLPWENVSDLKGDENKVALIYGISHYPSNFLIDKNGIIVAKDLRGEKLRNKLKELLR